MNQTDELHNFCENILETVETAETVNQKLYTEVKKLEQFTIVDGDVFKDNRLNPSTKIVYGCLATYRNSASNDAFPSAQRLAEDAGVTRNTVFKAIKQLVGYNYLSKTARYTDKGRSSNLYTFASMETVTKPKPVTRKTLKKPASEPVTRRTEPVTRWTTEQQQTLQKTLTNDPTIHNPSKVTQWRVNNFPPPAPKPPSPRHALWAPPPPPTTTQWKHGLRLIQTIKQTHTRQ